VEDQDVAQGPLTYDQLVGAARDVEPIDVTSPAKVEILAVNDTTCLVRIIARDNEIESKILDLSGE
jgi:hypothetical protein